MTTVPTSRRVTQQPASLAGKNARQANLSSKREYSPRFKGSHDYMSLKGSSGSVESLAREALKHAKTSLPGVVLPSKEDLVASVQALSPLPKTSGLQYALVQPDGTVSSPYKQTKALLTPFFRHKKNHLKKPTLVFVESNANGVKERIEKLKQPGQFTVVNHDHNKGVEIDRSFMLSDTISNLLLGNREGISEPVQNILPEFFPGKANSGKETGLTKFYRVTIPGNEELEQTVNSAESTQQVRRELLGLELLKKVYTEGSLEWKSVLVSAGAGAAGEPIINRLFPGGGPVASNVRTGLMSFLDIMGNVLSTFGMAEEKLAEQGKALNLQTVMTDKNAQHLIKSGIVGGGLGGVVLGVPLNYPAGAILSNDKASVLSRAVIGGMSASGSAVAIPKEIAETKEHYTEAIKKLISEGKIKYPKHVKSEQEQSEFVKHLANQEMNLRLNTAASIKAADPVPLVGTGFLTLLAEKVGIPRESVQTAFMATAPVMHNVLRLAFAVNEKYNVIPKRIKALESVMYDDNQVDASREDRKKKIENAFLPSYHNKLINAVGNKLIAYGAAVGMLFAEGAYLMSEKRRTGTLSQKSMPDEVKEKSLNVEPSSQPSPRPVAMPVPSPFFLVSPSAFSLASNPNPGGLVFTLPEQRSLPLQSPLPSRPIAPPLFDSAASLKRPILLTRFGPTPGSTPFAVQRRF